VLWRRAGRCRNEIVTLDGEESGMAELQLEGGELVLHLSGAEKAEAVRGDLRVPVSAIRGSSG
jgi:hypothetical protein